MFMNGSALSTSFCAAKRREGGGALRAFKRALPVSAIRIALVISVYRGALYSAFVADMLTDKCTFHGQPLAKTYIYGRKRRRGTILRVILSCSPGVA